MALLQSVSISIWGVLRSAFLQPNTAVLRKNNSDTCLRRWNVHNLITATSWKKIIDCVCRLWIWGRLQNARDVWYLLPTIYNNIRVFRHMKFAPNADKSRVYSHHISNCYWLVRCYFFLSHITLIIEKLASICPAALELRLT